MRKLTSKLVGLKTDSKVRGEGENDALTALWIFLIGVTPKLCHLGRKKRTFFDAAQDYMAFRKGG